MPSLPAANKEGTDGPFATLQRARDAIRQMKSAGQFRGPVTVRILQGTYYLEEPLLLGTEDSGTAEQPITYAAYPGHKPVVSGGRPINGWQPHQGKIVKHRLPEAEGGKWKFRQLFYSGQRQIRARWPNRDPEAPCLGAWAFIEATVSRGNGRRDC